MKNGALFGLVSASLLLLGLSSSLYAQGAAPDYVRIRDIKYAGSGCPAGSVGADVAGDLSAFTIASS